MRRISNTADIRAGLGIGEPSSELLNKDVRVWERNVRPRVVWLSSIEPNGVRPRIQSERVDEGRERNAHHL